MHRPLFIALLFAQAPLWGFEERTRKDVPYVQPKNERQTLDVYAPKEGKNLPIVFWIHGGGWQAGNKSQVEKKPEAFVEKNFVFVSTNYRLLPEAPTIKAMAQDIAKAIRWVHDHAEEFGGDPKRFFVMGHSAGAQLAALVCTDERYLKAEGLSLEVIKGCVPVDGDTYDVPLQIATVEERIANIYRRKFGDEASQKDLSPVMHVARGKKIPPFLILHVADHPETGGQSRRLVRTLKEAGVNAKAYPASGKDHRTLNDDLGKPGDAPTRALFKFVEAQLNLTSKAPPSEENTFRLILPAGATNIRRAGKESVTIAVERGEDFKSEVLLEFDAPKGLKVEPQTVKVAPDKSEVEIMVKAAGDAEIGAKIVQIKALGDGKRTTGTFEIEVTEPR